MGQTGGLNARHMQTMLNNLMLFSIQGAHAASLSAGWFRFWNATQRPESTQLDLLRSTLSANAGTAYGRRFDFEGIDSVERYRQKVPVVDYDEMEPWIQRVAAGESQVLTSTPVVMMERSGGSTSTNKLVPYTAELLDQFSRATGPWLCNLFTSHPALLGTRSYWSVSPVARKRETTEGGLPIGFEDESEYFGPVERWALRRTMAVDPSVARITDMDDWRFETARCLLEAGDLGLISVWSPTFLTQLMTFMEDNLERLLGGLTRERETAVREALGTDGDFAGEGIWPRLVVISSWADGASRGFVEDLKRFFPKTPIQPKGLLATEGVVSFPLEGHEGSVLALTSHFLEFQDLGGKEGDVVGAHELRRGGEYSPVLTTGGGLYRYHLKDVVRCLGHYHQAPLVRFEGKQDRVSDLVGEKVNARQVDLALEKARSDHGLDWRFALLAPGDGTPPGYVLYIESDADDRTIEGSVRDLEAYLSTGHHYRYARDLGQLAPMDWVRVRDGWDGYERIMVSRGMRSGDVKPSHLDHGTDWGSAFE